ncbi:MAG TPA: hypothetical protein VIW24_11220 [Aldersonia sp.]
MLCIDLDRFGGGAERVSGFLDRLHSAHEVSMLGMRHEVPPDSLRLDTILHERLLAACSEST